MHIITAGNKKFRKLIDQSVAHLEELGYDYTVYDLGGLGIGKEFIIEDDFTIYPFPPCYFKPAVIAHKLTELEEGEYLVFLDADAHIHKNIDEIVELDYDIGLTERTTAGAKPEEGRVNAGVMFLRNCENTRNFVQEWRRKTHELKGDQHALNTLLVDWDRITFFPCSVYNDPKGEKIVHYKNSKKL